VTLVAVPPEPTDERRLKQRVHRRLIEEGIDDPGTDVDALRCRLTHLLRNEHPLLASSRVDELLEQLTHEVAGLGPLEPLLGDPSVIVIVDFQKIYDHMKDLRLYHIHRVFQVPLS
jgi:hypothetical protein